MAKPTRPAEPTGSGRTVVFIVSRGVPGGGAGTDGPPAAVSLAEESGTATKLLLDYKGAAEALSLTEQALRDLVAKGYGPVVTKIRGRRMFAITDLWNFVEKHRCPPAVADSSSRGRRQRRQPR